MPYAPVIGLEIHVQLATKSKMFCGCSNTGETAPPNTTTCPVCMGHPGTLPVANEQAVRFGVRAGLALNCTIPNESKFDRKHYFYPDLPKGYQISQYDLPICVNGKVVLDTPSGERVIGITRAHLEEDAAKNVHAGDKSGVLASDVTLVDYNRAGSPLLEIVSEPDVTSPAEAKLFLTELRALMRTLGVSDADMEKGHMRCDANISLRLVGDDGVPVDLALNPKTEIKNLNSFKAVERALEFEIRRQTKLFDAGTPPPGNETRGWNETTGETEVQRTKEGAADYRYFPEPDLPPLLLATLAEEEKKRLPELPAQKRRRFAGEYGFSTADARTLVADPDLAAFTEQVISELQSWLDALPDMQGNSDEIWAANKDKLAKLVSGWLLSKLGGMLAEKNLGWDQLPFDAENFAEFLTLIHTSKINSTAAQTILAEMLVTGKDPSHILEDKGLGQITNSEELLPVVRDVVASNPNLVEQYKAGKVQVLKMMLGIVMKVTEGRAHPQTTEKMLKEEMG